MAFDLATAKPVSDSGGGGFDLSTAKPVGWKAPEKRTESPVEAPSSPLWNHPAVGAGEALLNMGTGMVAKPVSDVMGLAAKAKEVIAPGGGDPEAYKRHIQESLTYQPRGGMGQAIAQYNPMALLSRGVGAVAGGIGNAIRGDEQSTNVPRQVSGNLVQEAIQQAPGFVGLKAANALPPVIRSTSQDLMQSALKPTLEAMRKGDAAVAIDTMLDRGISLSKGGIAKLRDQIDTLNDQIKTAVQGSKGTIRPLDVYQPLFEKLQEFRKQVNPNADIEAIRNAWTEFRNHPMLAGKKEIPVPLAQELKQGTYRQLSKKYGQMGSAEIEAQKAIARGLKEGIAKNAPEVVEFNKEESRLLRALNVAERRVLMDANKNPMGLSLLARDPAAMAAFMLDRSATFKSILARILNASRQPTAVAAPVIGIGASQYPQLPQIQEDQQQ